MKSSQTVRVYVLHDSEADSLKDTALNQNSLLWGCRAEVPPAHCVMYEDSYWQFHQAIFYKLFSSDK